MKKFISSFSFICQFIFSIFSVSSYFLPFGIALDWAFNFIEVLGILLLSANLLLRNGFFNATNKLTHNCVFLAGFNAMIWYHRLILRFWLITVDSQKRFQSFKVLLINSNCWIQVFKDPSFWVFKDFKDLVFRFQVQFRYFFSASIVWGSYLNIYSYLEY